MIYTFNKADSGILGKAFEMAVKNALNRKNANRVSPCGTADFRYNGKNYDTKQNGSCLRYSEDGIYIKGANRVLYAVHIAHTMTEQGERVAVEVDLLNTEIFVLDRVEFVQFLQKNGLVKINASRGTANIQTCYNYKKDAYHGKGGRKIEEWARQNELDDDIVSIIYDACEE